MTLLTQQLGIDPKEEKIYLITLSLGQLSLGELSEKSGLPYLETEEIVRRLVMRGLLQVVPGLLDRFKATYPFTSFVRRSESSINKLTTVSQNLEEYLDGKIAAIRNDTERHHKKIGDEVSKVKDDIKVKKQQTSEEIERSTTELEEKLQILSNFTASRLANVFNDHGKAEKDNIDNLAATGTKIAAEITEGLLNQLDSASSQFINTLQKLPEEIDLSSSQFNEKLQTELKNLQETHLNGIKDLKDQQHNLISAEFERFAQELEKYRETVKIQTKQILAKTEKLAILASQKVGLIFKRPAVNPERIVEEVQQLLTEFQESISSTDISGYEASTVSVEEVVTSAFLNSQALIDSLQNLFSKKSENDHEFLVTVVQQLNNTVNNFRETNKSALTSDIERLSSEIQQLTGEFLEILEKTKQTTTANTEEIFEQTMLSSIAEIERFTKDAINAFGQIGTILEVGMDQSTDALIDEIQQQVDEIRLNLKNYQSRFTSESLVIGKELQNHKQVLDTLSEKVKGSEEATFDSAPITGKKAILNYVSRMIDELELTMTILVPSLSDLPLDKILSIKNHQRLIVIVPFNTKNEKDREILLKLFERINIKIRKLQPIQTTEGSSAVDESESYIASIRDSYSEILIASLDKNNHFSGIVSRNYSYCRLLSPVFNDYFIARRSRDFKMTNL